MEIEMFFAKYDNDGDGIFNIKEESLMMRDIDNDRVDSTVGRQCPLVLIAQDLIISKKSNDNAMTINILPRF